MTSVRNQWLALVVFTLVFAAGWLFTDAVRDHVGPESDIEQALERALEGDQERVSRLMAESMDWRSLSDSLVDVMNAQQLTTSSLDLDGNLIVIVTNPWPGLCMGNVRVRATEYDATTSTYGADDVVFRGVYTFTHERPSQIACGPATFVLDTMHVRPQMFLNRFDIEVEAVSYVTRAPSPHNP